MRYWINTASLNHVQAGVTGGFMQADHGRESRLKRLAKGDRVVFYSPRTEYRAGVPLQKFTAIAEVLDDVPYQVDVVPEFKPWRRQVNFLPGSEAPVQVLIEDLEFITNKKSWGFTFRRGFFEISEADFHRIAAAMHVALAA